MAKIYISSTYSDLAEHREAVHRTLCKMRHTVVAMEDYVATDERPLDKCRSDVAECDIYVGIIAWRCGYKPPGENQSITELEFREAVERGIPCLLFLLAEDAPWSPKHMDTDRTAIDRFREELARDYTVSFFSTPDQLAALVSAAVAVQAQPDDAPEKKTDASTLRFYLTCLEKLIGELSSRIRFCLVSSCALVAVGLAVVGAGFAVVADEMGLMVSLFGALISATTVYPISVSLHTQRKKALLDGLEVELSKDCPAAEALKSVEIFLKHQLQQVTD